MRSEDLFNKLNKYAFSGGSVTVYDLTRHLYDDSGKAKEPEVYFRGYDIQLNSECSDSYSSSFQLLANKLKTRILVMDDVHKLRYVSFIFEGVISFPL